MKSSSSRNNRKRRNGNNSRNIPRQLVARNSFRTELKYSTSGSLTANNGHNYLTIRGNSVFDPEYAVGGHQPLGFDQLAGLYNKYNVHSARVEVTAYNNSDTSAAGHPMTAIGLAMFPSVNDAPVSSTLAYVREQPYCVHTVIGPPLCSAAVRSLAAPRRTTQEVYGQNANDNDYKAVVTANPAKEWFYLIFARTLNGEPLDLNLEVMIYYDVTFFARKQLTPS